MSRLLIGVGALLLPLHLVAQQNPDLALTQAERDSVLAEYDQIFPIWGRKAIERGFSLPAPLGFNIGGFYANQDIVISDLGLGFNQPAQPVDFISFKGAQAKLTNFNVRADLWLFPFLNVYLMAGTGNGQTTVHLAEPVEFSTVADFKGSNFGIGFTGAFGIKRNFAVVDFNHQWGFSSLLKSPVPVNVLSMRYGKAFRVGQRHKRMRATVWIGTMFQSMKNATVGSINLADVVPPGTDSLFNGYQDSTWYQDLPPIQQALVDTLVQRLQTGLTTTVVNYTLNKKVADPWNLLIGGTYDVGRHWGLRGEVGFIGRKSFMLMANYRVGL
jgi:hypothetical protein